MLAFVFVFLANATPPESWTTWVRTSGEALRPEFARATARDLKVVREGEQIAIVRGEDGVRFEDGPGGLARLRFDAKKGVTMFVRDTARTFRLDEREMKTFALGDGVAVDGFARKSAPEFVAFVYDSRRPGLDELRKFEVFPYEEAFKTEAVFRKTATKDVQIPATRGEPKAWKEIGRLEFRLGAAAQTLTVYMDDEKSSELFLMFKDRSNGTSTYGGGRFLDAKLGKQVGRLADGDRVPLDFNFAYNPMCARSAAFLCPIAQDRLGVSVAAGEKRVGKR